MIISLPFGFPHQTILDGEGTPGKEKHGYMQETGCE